MSGTGHVDVRALNNAELLLLMKKESCKYKSISLNAINKYFEVTKENCLFKLRYGRAFNGIWIRIPFRLDEDVAALAGLMPDGSLIKDLMRIYFHQGKDYSKIILFTNLIKKLFHPQNRIFTKKDRRGFQAYTNSQTLAIFFYKILKIPKSDEQMRVPQWIFQSPKSVKIAYLREAFAMEGTILKKLSEIRFITKDYLFAKDIQKLLKQIRIEAIVKPRIGGTHRTRQYRISIYRIKNFALFKEIGFSTEFHKERFRRLCSKYGI
ncbi:MAG TPA: LAGLIDADG family homing endonuclease [Candidatus Nanoarchaeia archaeon]|nr:LAGLIDADG family homing endonuclease [Candidatus Nanoarchaeia archaeon]